MFELMFCSLITVLPDYLLRRRFQGKRLGVDINFFNVWYELRWGISLCLILTTMLLTIVFYFHPAATNTVSFFRTVTILSERAGRVEEIYVEVNQEVAAGDPVFRMVSSSEEAAAETARRQINEIDAQMVMARADLASAEAALEQAEATREQTSDELDRKQQLVARGSSAVAEQEIERLQNRLAANQGQVDAALAGIDSAQIQIETTLPSQRATAEAALAQAENEIAKMTVYAGIDGVVEQLTLRVGDVVNPILRPAGIIVPTEAGVGRFEAGFPQVSAAVVRPGGVAEIVCMTKPFSVIPMVITEVQNVIAAGQVRPSDQLLDAQMRTDPGTLFVYMEPIYPGQADDIPPGSLCLANAYTNNHARLEDPDIGFFERIGLHVVDTVGVVHAAGLRIRAILMPFQILVFSGH
ncbi:MAG: HlyD family secretion protein [Pseudomonadota bacterium]